MNLGGLTPVPGAYEQSPFSGFFLGLVVVFSTEFWGYTLIWSIHRISTTLK